MRSRIPRTIAAVLLVGVGAGQYLGMPTAWLRHGVVHVAPWGSDLLIGHARQWPLRSLARAVVLAAPGETILLWPGTYRETVLLRRGGLPGKPLRIRAAIPGTAVISGAAPPQQTARWHWRQRDPRVFTTTLAPSISALSLDDQAAFQAQSLPEFIALCRRHGAWPLFHAEAPVGWFRPRTLWLCLPDGSQPRLHRLTVHRPIPVRSRAGGHQTATLWIRASYVEISHLHFDFAVGAAIQLWDAREIYLHNNLFTAADVAINSNPSLRPPRRIRVEHNAYHHAPQHHWRRWLTWAELYRYSNSSLISLDGSDHTIRANLVVHSGDALKLATQTGQTRVSGNLIAGSSDDAIELDGNSAPILIDANLVVNSFAGISATPLPGGPVTLQGNLFLNGPSNGHNTWLKLLQGPIAALRLRDNLFVGEWIGWYGGGAAGEPLNSHKNRLFAVHRFGPHPAPDGALRHDRVVGLDRAQWPEPTAGPAALPGLPTGIRFNAAAVGPCWINPERMPPFRELTPLLRSGWLDPAPSRATPPC